MPLTRVCQMPLLSTYHTWQPDKAPWPLPAAPAQAHGGLSFRRYIADITLKIPHPCAAVAQANDKQVVCSSGAPKHQLPAGGTCYGPG